MGVIVRLPLVKYHHAGIQHLGMRGLRDVAGFCGS